MSLPDQEILDDIRNLISEITGFQENDENFLICERYCLSHVVHHTYPFINRINVKNLLSSYVSRFYSHGYFTVSQELNNQIKSFLSNTKLFEKNPQYDIQWCLLSLLSSLSSNLTSLKKLPELLSITDEENVKDDFKWAEYLLSDLPKQKLQDFNTDSTDLSMGSDTTEEEEESENERSSLKYSTNEKECQKNEDMKILFDNRMAFIEDSARDRKKKIEELLNIKKAERNIENDYALRKNISQKFDHFMLKEGISRENQLISEFELMEYILFQFQTGERILLQKGFTTPALTSLTQETLGSYLESLQPYFKIIRCFNDFDADVTKARFPHQIGESVSNSTQSHFIADTNSLTSEHRKIPNVLYIYNTMLRRAIEPFKSGVTEIAQNLSRYTLLQMENKLKPYYFYLTSLFSVHNLATKNWTSDSNCKLSVRILSALYNAIMNATSPRMSFLYLNLFLHCFQVYLEFIDSWITFVDLNDPFEEFVVAKSDETEKSQNKCSEYVIRPYKSESENFGEIMIIDFISEKMIHVGQSLEVLRLLNRFVEQETSGESSFRLLLKSIDETVRSLERNEPEEKDVILKEKKKKGIFTINNSYLGLEKDNGGGDFTIGNLLIEVFKEEEKNNQKKNEPNYPRQSEKFGKNDNYCKEVINSIKNPFFKLAFNSIGIKQVQKKLEEAKEKVDVEDLMLIREPTKNRGVYPLHKIIAEAVYLIVGDRVSGACSLVKDIIMKECNLLMHLSLFRSVFLFNDFHLIQPFVLALFNQPIIWESSYSLSIHLKESVRSFYKDYANALSVNVKKSNSTKCENILQVIDVITVNYEVKWPLTLILTPEALNKYNEIFRLALKLKWAHWALCNIYFSGKVMLHGNVAGESECGSKSTRHRVYLLRFWLLSALGRVHNYFLAQMVPFDLKLNSCKDLKEIINGHSEFLEKIYHNCLLGEKFTEGRKLIAETLIPLCMELLLESENIDDVRLSSIEKTFGSCHLHLTRLLSSLEK